MSEKHLTEAAWKTLAAKAKVKDTALQKLLQAYAKTDAAKAAAQALGLLEEISLQSARLKKANSTAREVTAYLEEIIKEANKAKLQLSSLAQPSGSEVSAVEGKGSTDAGLRERLIGALKKIRTADGDGSLGFMACVAKPCYGILFGKNPGEKLGPAHKKELTQLTQGTRFIEGKCLLENEAYTFVVEAVPTGLARNLKIALKHYTGLAYKIRVRDVEGKVVADADAESASEQTATAGSANPPAPSAAPKAPAGEEMAKFTARLRSLQPEIVKTIAAKSPQSTAMKQGAIEAGTLANKKDFVRANQLLDRIEALLKRDTSGPTPASRAPTGDALFQPAWASATAHLREALETVQQQLAGFGAALMASGEDNLVWIAEEGLSEVFSSLRNQALAVDRATSKLPARVVFKARPAIEALKKQISSPRVLACDQNRVGVRVSIHETISKAIQELEAALELATA